MKNIYQKINEVQKSVQSVFKDAEISQGNNSYSVVTHDAVTKALHLPMANAGLVLWYTMEECILTQFEKKSEYQGKEKVTLYYRADLKLKISLINSDEPTDRIDSIVHSFAFDTSDKAIGKAMSLGVKTMQLKTFMLESLDYEEERKLEDNYSYNQNKSYQRPQSSIKPAAAIAPKPAAVPKTPQNMAPGASPRNS